MRIKIRELPAKIGPGFITGASDDDPASIGTYSQTGALFGYSQLWLALLTFLFMVTIQEMCGRIGMVTGQGLSSLIRTHYSKGMLSLAVSLLIISNTISIGADLGAMAVSARMIIGLPFAFWLVLMAAFILLLEIFLQYKTYAGVLKFMALSLVSYIITAFVVRQDWGEIVKSTFVPRIELSKEYILNVLANLGGTLSPYLFFWQTSQEVEEKTVAELRDIADMRFDTAMGMLYSQAVMFFIIVTTASTLNAHGITNIETAAQAASALRPLAGEFAYHLFALGIVGTGLLAIPILAGSTSYAVSEAFEWKGGLSKKCKESPGFYGVIVVSTIIGLLINLAGIDPIKALYYSSALNGLLAPPLLVFILLIANKKEVMGGHANKGLSNILGWTIIVMMSVSGVLLLTSH